MKALDPEFKALAEEADKRIKELERSRPTPPMIRALWDRGQPSPTFILRRGDYLNPGRWVEPATLTALNRGGKPLDIRPPWPGSTKTGRRLAFARWMTNADAAPGALIARVAVNRIWKHHFQHGIVRTLGNFGTTGAPPTHPELLDWLAAQFVRNGWSRKSMHRLIMTSSTYRQSSEITPATRRSDPRNELLSHFPLKRLEAESLRDTMLFVAGRLNRKPFGPSDSLSTRDDGLVTVNASGHGWRRSIYVQQRRKQLPTILEAFDVPEMNPNCLERRSSTVATQALYMMNNKMVHELAGSLADRIHEQVGDDFDRQIDALYRIVLSRLPDQDQRVATKYALLEMRKQWNEQANASDDQQRSPALRALDNLCHALLNSAEFVYVD